MNFNPTNMKEKILTEELVYKKIKDAGWMVRLFGFLICVIGIIFLILTVYAISRSGLEEIGAFALLPLALLSIGIAIYYYSNKLYKTKLPLNTCKTYLIIFTILFFPTILSIVGLIVEWHTISALSALLAFKKAH